MIVGYARVSTTEQKLDLQIHALMSAGCAEIFTDHGMSGATHHRPGLVKAINQLKPGDKLVVWRLDRLGRSLGNLVLLMKELGDHGAGFHSLTENIDTGSSAGRLVFHFMAALAEFERSLISDRTRAGMEAARAMGKKLGRRPSLTSQQCDEAFQLIDTQDWTMHKMATHFGVHPRTLQRLMRKRSELQCVNIP